MNIHAYFLSLASGVLVAAGIWLQGCGTVVHVTLDGRGDSVSYVEFNRKVALEKLHVRTNTMYTRSAQDFNATPDSCVWRNAETGERLHAPLAKLRQVTFVDRFRGLWTGVLYGGLGGVGLGYGVFLAGDWSGRTEKGLAAIALPATFGTVGVLTGGLIGIVAGYEVEYVIHPYGGGATVVYLRDGSRIIGSVEELVAEKYVVVRAWDGSRVVIDYALIERIDVQKSE